MFSMNDGKSLSMLLVAICLTAASCDTSTDETSPEDVSESPVVEQPEQETESSYIDPAEAEQIDVWIKANDLNRYGDRKDIVYSGGTPLFDESTGSSIDRYDYILKNHKDRLWRRSIKGARIAHSRRPETFNRRSACSGSETRKRKKTCVATEGCVTID